MNEPTNEIATTTQPQRAPVRMDTARQMVASDYFRLEVAKVLPKHINPVRFARCVETQMRLNPKLEQCEPKGLALRLLQLAQLGLEPDGRRAHLIPFKNNKAGTMEAQLIVGYQGYAELAQNTGHVSSIHADVVCENDDFIFDRGALVRHRIDFRKPRGDAYAAYALIRFKDGSEKCEPMTKEEVLKARDQSSGWKAYQKGWTKDTPWAGPFEYEMWKKTAFRRAVKWISLSPEIRELSAIEDDEHVVHAEVQSAPIATRPRLFDKPPAAEPTPPAQEAAAGAERETKEQGHVPAEPPAKKKRGRKPKPPEDDIPMDDAPTLTEPAEPEKEYDHERKFFRYTSGPEQGVWKPVEVGDV